MYATKRRQRNFKRVREAPKSTASSNPSKRHRERLNAELETVASLLPFDQTVISRLDKLSVLRLAVSFIQAKTHFQGSVQKLFVQHPYYNGGYGSSLMFAPVCSAPSSFVDAGYANEENIFKALGGFVLILNENGEIYYTSENIETYLGFHQSDILHQPVFDMIHSEDREDLRQQLCWNYALPPTVGFHDIFTSDGLLYMERNASARFRCLLDNTCGFLRIDIRGKLVVLHSLPHCYLASRPDPTIPVLGLLAVCTPFVPPPNLDGPDTEPFLKTKHALDFSVFSIDSKAKSLLEVDENSLPLSFYSIVHHDDAPCLGEAHKEATRSGASGLLVYRIISRKTYKTYWLQSSCRLFYKNGKPESIGCTHRLLTEVEGETLLDKRTSLSAKLLSFDDSLLQSPRLLQSTAALTSSAAAQKLKNKRVRPPTVGTTTFRDPTIRANSAALRSAAAAAALAANPSIFTVQQDPAVGSLDLARFPYPGGAGQHSSGWTGSGTRVRNGYYGYLPSSNIYPYSHGANGYPCLQSHQGLYHKELASSRYLAPQKWAIAQAATFSATVDPSCPEADFTQDWTGKPLKHELAADPTSHSFAKASSRSGGTSDFASPAFNFSMSEVTNTLLGQ